MAGFNRQIDGRPGSHRPPNRKKRGALQSSRLRVNASGSPGKCEGRKAEINPEMVQIARGPEAAQAR